MKPDAIRSLRLNSLAKIWLKNRDADEVTRRALLMGVTSKTAKNYVETIMTRYP